MGRGSSSFRPPFHSFSHPTPHPSAPTPSAPLVSSPALAHQPLALPHTSARVLAPYFTGNTTVRGLLHQPCFLTCQPKGALSSSPVSR